VPASGFALVKDTHRVKVLYDALEMEDPTVDMALLQEKMDAEVSERLGPIPLRRAILVPNTRIAFLARIASGSSAKARTASSITTWRSYLVTGG
jgi:hypothetical protein